MKGKNELHLNEATMVEAIQQYLDAEMKYPSKVKSVMEISNSSNTIKIFKITVDDPEACK